MASLELQVRHGITSGPAEANVSPVLLPTEPDHGKLAADDPPGPLTPAHAMGVSTA
jgi:hypothetical protein